MDRFNVRRIYNWAKTSQAPLVFFIIWDILGHLVWSSAALTNDFDERFEYPYYFWDAANYVFLFLFILLKTQKVKILIPVAALAALDWLHEFLAWSFDFNANNPISGGIFFILSVALICFYIIQSRKTKWK